MATGRLFLWSAALGEWVSCPPDEITWLDRRTLSADEDVTLHRAPRCAGLRYVHHRWELFSRDTTYRIYLAPGPDGTLARTVYLDAEPGSITADVALAGLQRRRSAVEGQLEELKERKGSMSAEEYEAELERVLIELARIGRQIRQRS